jgi:hypothetical protein
MTKSSNAAFPWLLAVRWLLGLYLIAGCLYSAYMLNANWQPVHDMRIIDPNFNFYALVVAWGCKLVTGVLLLLRSKWLLLVVPAWIGSFLYDLLDRNALSQLGGDFYLAFAIQACLLSFVLWMHGRGKLR